jgi:hypothetical protein
LNFDIDKGVGFRLTFRQPSIGKGSEVLNNLLGKLPRAKVEEFKFPKPTGGGMSVVSDRVVAAMKEARPSIPAGVIRESARNATAAVAVLDSDATSKPGADEFDVHASSAISKGQRNEPFTISWRSQREVVESLAWKSTACIWGGPLLTVVCLYFLMIYFGWIS